ncbi:MAG: hypothetical protein R3E52_06535 [Burkholderiaceae bacterium]
MGQFEPNYTVSERGLDRDCREVLQGIWGPIAAKGGVDNEVVLATFYSKMLTVVALRAAARTEIVKHGFAGAGN